jgi:hypothetical protein
LRMLPCQRSYYRDEHSHVAYSRQSDDEKMLSFHLSASLRRVSG